MIFNRCYACMENLPLGTDVCPRCGYDNSTAPAMQPNHALPCGTILNGQYVVGRMLGQGGFGITYICYDLKLERRVCVKEYFPDGAAMRSATASHQVYWGTTENAQALKQGRESFLKEARKAVRLSDLRHVVTVWDVFYENETAYIVMDYIEGETLKNYLKRTKQALSESACLRLLTPVMADLEEIHRRGIIHRDIKPDNLMVNRQGELVLLDMGAAKDLSGSGRKSSALVASYGYSPVEQYRRSGNIGPWTDVYALCATIYSCVTRQVPPSPTDRQGGEKLILNMFSSRFAAALERGLELEPEKRFQSVAELREALYNEPAPKPLPEEKPSRVKRILPFAAVALLAFALAFGASRLLNRAASTSVTEPAPVAALSESTATPAPTAAAASTQAAPEATAQQHVHSWGPWTVIKAASCEEAGLETRICELDASHVEQQIIPVLGHVWQPATDKQPETCSRCGLTRGSALMPKPGPSYLEDFEYITAPKSSSWLSAAKTSYVCATGGVAAYLFVGPATETEKFDTVLEGLQLTLLAHEGDYYLAYTSDERLGWIGDGQVADDRSLLDSLPSLSNSYWIYKKGLTDSETFAVKLNADKTASAVRLSDGKSYSWKYTLSGRRLAIDDLYFVWNGEVFRTNSRYTASNGEKIYYTFTQDPQRRFDEFS